MKLSRESCPAYDLELFATKTGVAQVDVIELTEHKNGK